MASAVGTSDKLDTWLTDGAISGASRIFNAKLPVLLVRTGLKAALGITLFWYLLSLSFNSKFFPPAITPVNVFSRIAI